MEEIFIVPDVRTPSSRIDGALAVHNAVELSVPVVQALSSRLARGTLPDLVVWGSLVPNLSCATSGAKSGSMQSSIRAYRRMR